MFVWVMGGALTKWYMTLHHRKESPATLGTLRFKVRRRKPGVFDPNHNSSGQAIAVRLRDDGLPLVLSAVICLFGSWVGSDKGEGCYMTIHCT